MTLLALISGIATGLVLGIFGSGGSEGDRDIPRTAIVVSIGGKSDENPIYE